MAVKKTYRINLRNYGSPPAVMVSQYDEGYAIAFEIFDGPLPVLASSLSGYTFKLKGRQPGNPPFLAYEFEGTLATALNAVVSFEIDTTMTGRAGKGTAELVILDEENDVKFASVNFAVYTEPAAVPDGSIDADVERAQEIADEVAEIVDGATEGAEAWAVGQRGGVDVESTDPTYHNNAKYYAESISGVTDQVATNTSDISDLKEDLNVFRPTAAASDVGKALIVKTVADGVPTEFEYGETGSDTSELEALVEEMNDFGTVSEDVDKTSDFVTGYYPADGAVGSTASTTLNTNSNYRGIYVAVSAGETVTLSARGNSHTTYAFTDGDFKILSKSGYEAHTNEVLTVTEDGYLFVTTQYTYPYKLIIHRNSTIALHDKMDEVDGAIDAVEEAIDNIPKWMAKNILGGATPWNTSERTVTGTGASNIIKSGSANIANDEYTLNGDVIYLSAMAKASGSPTKLILGHTNDVNIIETAIQNIPTADTWYRLSSIDRQVSATTPDYRYIEIHAYYADASAQSGQTLTYKCGIALNLTTIFGAGNEPTDVTVIDAMLSKYTDGWFAGTQDIWNPSIIKWLAESYKSYMNGTYYGSDGKRFVAGSIIDRYDSQWDHGQAEYGISKTLVPVDNKFEGGIRTNGMVNVFPKYGRWERGAAGTDSGSLFGGHVFEAWNNIRSYRLTMMMGHGGDKVSYTDGNGVTHETPREDEACIIVYSPANSYANPPITPTEEQSKLRINKAQEDYYGESAQNLLGRVRIGGDTPTQGTVFTKNKMITYGRIILADTSQINKGKQLVFNNDGTITWTEVTLYQHPEPAPYEE